MRDRLEHRRTDIGLRAAGAALSGGAWLALRVLMHLRLPPPPTSPGPLAYALAAVAFFAASAGLAMLLLGHHLFDQVEISGRWQSSWSDPVARRSPPR